jgi:hypothetical protein
MRNRAEGPHAICDEVARHLLSDMMSSLEVVRVFRTRVLTARTKAQDVCRVCAGCAQGVRRVCALCLWYSGGSMRRYSIGFVEYFSRPFNKMLHYQGLMCV